MIVLERHIDPNLLHRRLFASVAIAALTFVSTAADAQMAYGNADPSVIVDLSVLDDGGFGSSGGSGAASSVRPGVIGASGQPRLLMPGAQAPASTLHVPPPVERRSLARAPAERPAASRPSAPTAAAPATVMPPARPSPPVVAATPPVPPVATIAPPASSSTTTAALPAPPPPPTIAPAPTPRQTPIARTEPAAPVQAVPAPAAPPPPAAPQAAPRADERPTEQAARPAVPPDAVKGPAPAMTVPFGADASRIPPASQEQLKTLANQMKDKAEARIQLIAYASGDELTSSRARRLSLSRALAVRSVLIDLGVRSTRIDVRALGDKAADDPQNRVDVVVTER